MDINTLLSTLARGAAASTNPQSAPNSTAASGKGVDPAVQLAAAAAGRGDDPAVQLATAAAGRAIDPVVQLATANPPATTPSPVISPDVYYSPGMTTTPSLLAQSGVNAYVQLLNAVSLDGLNEKSASLLTDNLRSASAALKSAYQQAVARLPTTLAAKDWRFSISNGSLVFAQGDDELSPQDVAHLEAAFAGSDVEAAAHQVAIAITSMESTRSAGASSGSLAWGRFAVDESNFGEVVNLRAYLTATAPGGKYNTDTATGDSNSTSNLTYSNPNTSLPASHTDIPLTLGGMYLGDLVTTRPDFFRPPVSTRADALDESDAALGGQISETLRGRCSCGEVCFTVQNALDYAFYCHCSRCRTRTGSAFAAIGGANIDKLLVTTGNKHLLIEGECADGFGARCSRCFTFLFAAVRDRRYVHISLGVLGGTPNRLPSHHIYVGSKAPWYQITDGLPQYDELP